MQYFKPAEFREWHSLMSIRLLTMMDMLRFTIGKYVSINEAIGALP